MKELEYFQRSWMDEPQVDIDIAKSYVMFWT